ncbi:methionine--tRNA ligase [Candidatus Bandiella euplotis]|uniref:Methionine--tRNA ligase n=1 Tax=Candidatus Bandiella euplotis TaxID=1664265 RepID=A0ABZ0UQ02_9RICK|nr:methionine--tRNA ligase [Candidatus Bandiella woodruffii]WPX96975.1 Methionine--tRNA ligase [Candidatus Bandiella woodruffii]
MRNFYITTPIYYVNDKPHIGHAYTSIAADVIARFKRLDGFNVKFLTGTDEHGEKVEKSAKHFGYETQEFVDKMALNFSNLAKDLNLSNDDFIRTTETRHKDFVTKIWRTLLANGEIYLGKYAGWYSVRDEAYYSEAELVGGKAPTGASVEWLEEPSYFFKLSAWQDRLLAFYEANPDFIKPESRRNEVISFVKSGLHDLSISRTSFTWGIPVPNDGKHVIYVWLDALFNYVSALGTEQFWPADLHIIGKDILRFHAVYWPAFLMAANLMPPKRVFAHGWWTNEGEKISKSLGNVINPYDVMDKYGLDYFRYYLMKEMTFGNDGNFSYPSFIDRINSELVNKVGNLIHRTISFIYKNCGQKMPYPAEYAEKDRAILSHSYQLIEKIRVLVDNQSLKQILEEIIDLANAANVFIDEEAPWKLKESDPIRMQTVMYVLAEVIRVIAVLLQPFMPESSAQALDCLDVKQRTFNSLNSANGVIPGTEIVQPKIIFNKIE